MRSSRCIRRPWLAIFFALLHHRHPTAGGASDPLLDALDEAILSDIIKQYAEYEESTCDSPSSPAVDKTSFSFEYPGTNPSSKWNPDFVPFEESLFQAIMSHEDRTASKSWSIRIGRGGQMYSHFASGSYGETMPPQNNAKAPWVDEVQQSVSISLQLNQNLSNPQYCPGPDKENATQCKKYYIHQAGAYQNDGNYTSVPFFSPALARHCERNFCMFATWGTHAQVPVPFTSPILYINKFTNCDNGVIEHTQMIHNFADPKDDLSTPLNADQTWMNVGWGGVRTSALPFALEPDPSTGTLSYEDVNGVDYLDLCKFSEVPEGRAAVENLKMLGGYTTFVDGRLLVNQTLAPILLPCRKSGADCTASPSTCMVESCNKTDIDNGYDRIQLRVLPNNTANCQAYEDLWNGLVQLKCGFHARNFGHTFPSQDSFVSCAPWAEVGLFNRQTGEGINIAYLRHWSFNPADGLIHFAVYTSNKTEAITTVNSIFDNSLGGSNLDIDVRPVRRIFPQGSIRAPSTSLPLVATPSDYNPKSLETFTFVYGKADEYGIGKSVPGLVKRRIGSTEVGTETSRDFSVFSVIWYGFSGGSVRLIPGRTYVNRGYYFIDDLESVSSRANDLVEMTHAAQIEQEEWSPRTVDIYRDGTKFVAVAASSAKGNSTTCDSPSASLVCSGTSTPRQGHVPFFYVTCGASLTYFGSNPYNFTPSFGINKRFPGHGSINNIVRSYVCDGMDVSIRPTWKMMGFFNSSDADCASLATAKYNGTVCIADPTRTASPTTAPTTTPTARPSASPTNTAAPSKAPTATPTARLSASPTNTAAPSKAPTATPTARPSASTTITAAPSKAPAATPTARPSALTNAPTASPPASTSASPTNTAALTNSPTTVRSTPSPTTLPEVIEIVVTGGLLEFPYYSFQVEGNPMIVSSYKFIRGNHYKFVDRGTRASAYPFFMSDQGRVTASTFPINSTGNYRTGIPPGGSLDFQLPLNFAGTLTYYCTTHQQMTNTFKVRRKNAPSTHVPTGKPTNGGKSSGKPTKRGKSSKSTPESSPKNRHKSTNMTTLMPSKSVRERTRKHHSNQ